MLLHKAIYLNFNKIQRLLNCKMYDVINGAQKPPTYFLSNNANSFAFSAKAITMDAAFFNILQNKSYFYHGDRYFVFKHSHNRIMFVEAGSLKEEKPWLPTPLDAVYKSRKVSASNKIEHQAYAVVMLLYLYVLGRAVEIGDFRG